MKKIQVPADLFLTLARIYKQHKDLDQMSHAELKDWRQVHQLELRAQSAVDQTRRRNHETGSEQHGETGPR